MIASFADPGPAHHPARTSFGARPGDRRARPTTGSSGPDAQTRSEYTDMHIFAKELPAAVLQMAHGRAAAVRCAAAGMAETGLVPFASTYSAFAARRALMTSICLDIAEPGLNVSIVGGLPGTDNRLRPVAIRPPRTSAIFRGMPGLTIVDPCDSVDIAQAVPQLARLRRTRRTCVAAARPGADRARRIRLHLRAGQGERCGTARDVVFVSSGLMTMRGAAGRRRARLAGHRVDAAVVHSPTLKPFDADTGRRRGRHRTGSR